MGADAVLIAYNFDERSKAYVGMSLANKLPECLISGNPLLLHGPADIATVREIHRELPECVVDQPDMESVRKWLQTMVDSRNARLNLGKRCRELALARFSITERRAELRNLLTEAARGV
jgi:hypothetical protein